MQSSDECTPIIELKNVDKYYGEEVRQQVLFDINLVIKQGSFIAIIGQSGSGKSTLLNLIATLDRPTSGKLIINGKKVTNMSEKQLAKLRNVEIGFILQQHFLLPEFNVIDNIVAPYRILHGEVPIEIHQRALDLVNDVDLRDVVDKKISQLSGGQQQRVAIARALINNPPIVLADEPATSLDSKSTDAVYDLLRRLNRDYGTTFLLITHNPHVADKADRVIELENGRIISDIGSPRNDASK